MLHLNGELHWVIWNGPVSVSEEQWQISLLGFSSHWFLNVKCFSLSFFTSSRPSGQCRSFPWHPTPKLGEVPLLQLMVPTQITFDVRSWLLLWEFLESRTWSPPLFLWSLAQYLAQKRGLNKYFIEWSKEGGRKSERWTLIYHPQATTSSEKHS